MAGELEHHSAPELAHRLMQQTLIRAMFIAGFSYYEVGRFGFYHVDLLYLIFMSGALVLSILSASTGTFCCYRMAALPSEAQRVVFHRRMSHIFAAAHIFFWLAGFCYMSSFLRIGYHYYPGSQYRYVPAVVAAAGISLWGLFWLYLLYLRFFAGPPREAQNAKGSRANMKCIESDADGISTQAVCIAAFAQAGVARFLVSGNPIRLVYLVAVSLSCIISMLCVFALSSAVVVLHATYGGAYLRKSRLMVYSCYGAVISSLIVFLVGFSTVGWGTDYGDAGQWVALAMGITSVALIGVAGVIILRAYRKVAHGRSGESQPLLIAAPAPGEDAARNPLSSDPTTPTQSIVEQLNAFGGGASIVSVYVFYNVVTVHTDLKNCPNNCVFAFVMANAPAFGFALVAQAIGAAVRLVINLLPEGKRDAFSRAVQPAARLSAVCYAVSLVFFTACFAIYGYAKLRPHQVSTFVLGGIGLLGFAGGEYILRQAYLHGKRAPKQMPESESPDLEAIPDSEFRIWKCTETHTWHLNGRRVLEHKRIVSQLSMISNNSLFFGGFAYFAVTFLMTAQRSISDVYCVIMGSAFILSINLVVYSTLLKSFQAQLLWENQREAMARRLITFFRVCYKMFELSILLFFAGFTIIGFVKNVDHYRWFAYPMLVGGPIGALAFVYALRTISRAASKIAVEHTACIKSYKEKVKPVAKSEVADANASDLQTDVMTRLQTSAMMASFVAGNVFFEILFGGTDGPFGNAFYYYSVTTFTFVTGSVGVVTVVAITVWLTDVAGGASKWVFGSAIDRFRIWSEWAFQISQFTLVASVGAMGPIKFPEYWVVTLAWSCAGLCTMTFMAVYTKRIHAAVLTQTASLPLAIQ